MGDNQEDRIYLEDHIVSFTEKKWYEFAGDFVKRLPNEAGTFLTAVVSLWAIAEVLMAATGDRVPIENLATPTLIFALALSVYKAYLVERRYVPEPLLNESQKTQLLYRRQRCGWNAAIARQMLLERIEDAEGSLSRIERGAEFTEPEEIDYEDYLRWLRTRPKMLTRLLHSTALLCTKELPKVVGSTKSEDDLAKLKMEIEALARVYKHAQMSEIECHRILPPEELECVHEMTVGWTKPIRNGVSRLVEILGEIASVDRRQIKKGTAELPDFAIDFESPENIEEFCRRLNESENVLESS